MSVQTQIERLTANVAAALTEIANKGVVVPGDANSDDLAVLIEAIPLTIPTAAVVVERNSTGTAVSGVSGQVERLNSNIQAALTAVAGKEVTVPGGATSDELAALIASIVQAPATAFVYVYGAPSETVTLTHTDGTVYTVSTNANGASETTIELPPGDYTVVGSVSKDALPSGRSVTVENDATVVTAYPPGAIFWFGNGDASGDTLYSKCGGWTPIAGAYPSGQGRTGAAWSTYAYGQASGTTGWYTFANHARSSSQYGATSRITNLIDYTGYTKINVRCSSGVQNSGKSGIGTCASGPTGEGAWTAQVYSSLGSISTTNKSLTLTGSSGYFCAAAFGANYAKPYGSGVYYAHTADNTVYAVWLE